MIPETNLQRPAADTLAATLAQFPPATSAALRRMGVLRHWQDGDVVLRAGTVAASALMLVQGRLRFAATSQEGHEVLFRWFVPGEFVGLASILGHVPLPAEAIAAGQCEAIHFDADQLLEHLRGDAGGSLFLAGMISRFASEIANLVVTLTAGTLEERIWSVLARLASHEATKGTTEGTKLMVSHQDLAFAVGASRQRVNIELHKLELSGRIRLGYRHLVILRDAPSGTKPRAY